MTPKVKTILIAIICILVLFLSWAGVRACRLSNSHAELKGKQDILLAENVKIKGEAEKDRAAANEKIAALNISIIEHQHKEVVLERSLTAKDSDLSKLKADFSLIRDCPGQVVNLQAQVANLEQTKIDQGQYIVKLRGERDDWHGKFDAQVIISESWKKQYVSEHGLRLNLEVMTSTLRRDIWWAKFGSNLKTGAIVVEAAVFGYLYLRKK